MAIMLSKTYDALIDAGASKEIARAAAEEIASMKNRLAPLEVMITVILAGTVTLVIKVFIT